MALCSEAGGGGERADCLAEHVLPEVGVGQGL